MSEVKKLTAVEKQELISGVDASFGDAVKSMRKKMIEDNYLTSATQVATLDKILVTVKENENNTLHKVIFDKLVAQKQVLFISNIKELFKEGWMLSKIFRFYTGGMPIKQINAWKMKDIMSVIEHKDKSQFEKIFTEDKTKGKVFKKPAPKNKGPKPVKVQAKDIPVIVKKAT